MNSARWLPNPTAAPSGGEEKENPLAKLPENGDVRNDGFVFRSGAWRSPESIKKHNGRRRVTQNLPATDANAGQAGEFLVACDLLARGLAVTKPLNINGAHDLHVRCGGAWRTIQVKSGEFCNGKIYKVTPWRLIKSDVLALVFIPEKLIRYVPQPGTTLPEELCQSLITTVRTAAASPNATSVSKRLGKSNSAKSADTVWINSSHAPQPSLWDATAKAAGESRE